MFAFAAAIATLLGASDPAPPPPPKVIAPPTRYCIDEARTGSRIAVRACRTRAEWLARDFDPLKPGQ